MATEQDLLATPRDGQKYELVDGQIRVSPAGARHGHVCVKLSIRLGAFVEEQGFGFVFDSSTGFRLPNGNVRLPDVTFLAKGRLEGDLVPTRDPVDRPAVSTRRRCAQHARVRDGGRRDC